MSDTYGYSLHIALITVQCLSKQLYRSRNVSCNAYGQGDLTRHIAQFCKLIKGGDMVSEPSGKRSAQALP